MSKPIDQNGLINEYLKINEAIINLLIVVLVGVHTIAFLLLGYALVCKFLFIPFH
jgi:phage shock protein PspC (stress-responsive transcriptional regulator)